MNLPSIDCIRVVVSNWTLWNVRVAELKMDTMASVWNVVENVRVTSGAVELAIFTAILYWFFTSSRVADMLELVGERVGGWCGRDPPTPLRQAASRAKRRHNADVYARLEQERNTRASSLYKVKNHASVPLPVPPQQPSTGLACARCAPKSRESWQDSKTSSHDNGPVINILDIGRQNFANGGVLSRYFCDFAQCSQLPSYDFKDVVPDVIKDDSFQRAIDDTTERELMNEGGIQAEANRESLTLYTSVRRRVEGRAVKVLRDISSAMSTRVLKLVAWLCHKAIRRVAGGGCGTRGGAVARIARARASGLPLVFVPLHRSHFDYVLVTFTLYLMGIRPPLVAAGDNMRIPFFGWFLRGCGAFYIKRKVNGSEHNGDSVYKTALRSYILHSLSNKNNLEFFIEGGRTRTGKPQPPKAGILSVIMDAYLDGTIDDALLVPVTLNYDRLVDGNFVREQLGRPKQMETFWSALRGIWRTLNTDHGGIRVDFNQPISLKELVTSFQRFNYLQEPVENNLASLTNNNLGSSLDRQILYSNSHSSLYGADVTHTHKMTVEAIGRHLVYDASQATAIMSTNLVAYVLLCESRARLSAGVATSRVCSVLETRHDALSRDGRDLTHAPHAHAQLKHALDMLGRSLVRREGSGDKQVLKAVHSIPANIELAYYANTIIAHYAPQAIVVTAIESILCSQDADQNILRHSEVITQSLVLSAILSQELILCPPCRRTEELLEDTMQRLASSQVFNVIQVNEGLSEQQWSRRFARQFDDEDEEDMVDRTSTLKYRVNRAPEALAERRRLLLTLRPLLEGYAATCRCLTLGKQSHTVEKTLDHLTQQFVQGNMIYGEAVSTDAIRNCMKMLKQWGIIDIENEGKDRIVSLRQPYENRQEYDKICQNVYKFNMNSPLLANDNVFDP